MTREEADVSVIGRGARIEGTLVSAGSLTIHGQLKGDISADGEVSVSADSVVDADITAFFDQVDSAVLMSWWRGASTTDAC